MTESTSRSDDLSEILSAVETTRERMRVTEGEAALSLPGWIDRARAALMECYTYARHGDLNGEAQAWVTAAAICCARAEVVYEKMSLPQTGVGPGARRPPESPVQSNPATELYGDEGVHTHDAVR